MSETKALYDQMMRTKAALLTVDPDGPEWVHQAGGVAFYHPSEHGYLKPLPEEVRNEVHDRFFGRTPTEFDVRELMMDFDLPWEPDPLHHPVEAWVRLVSTEDENAKAILIWDNSD